MLSLLVLCWNKHHYSERKKEDNKRKRAAQAVSKKQGTKRANKFLQLFILKCTGIHKNLQSYNNKTNFIKKVS